MKLDENILHRKSSHAFKNRFIVLLFIGILSMVFAEVYSGASPLWFINLWALFVTFPLYWSHFLFFFTLAVKTKRYDPWSLYLWGCLFGLYESWITKVIWTSFYNQPPLFGRYLGFAIGEMFLVTFFWHPIMSFIAPLMVFEIFSLSSTEHLENFEKQILSSHMVLMQRNKRNLAAAIFLTIFGASISTINFNFNFITVTVTVFGSLLIILVFYKLSSSVAKNSFSIRSLVLGRLGFVIVTVYLIALYIFSYVFIFPENIPPLATQLITLMLYAFIGLLLYVLGPSDREERGRYEICQENKEVMFSTKDIWFLYGLFSLLALFFCFTPFLCIFIATCCLFMIIGSGIILISIATVKSLANIHKTRQKYPKTNG